MYIIIFYNPHNVCAAQFVSPSNCNLALIYQPLHTYLSHSFFPCSLESPFYSIFMKISKDLHVWEASYLIYFWIVIIYISNLAIFLVKNFYYTWIILHYYMYHMLTFHSPVDVHCVWSYFLTVFDTTAMNFMWKCLLTYWLHFLWVYMFKSRAPGPYYNTVEICFEKLLYNYLNGYTNLHSYQKCTRV